MRLILACLVSVAGAVALSSCHSLPTTSDPDLLAATGGTDRPFKGVCSITVEQRTHEEGEEGGGCGGGGGEEDPAGGPPIARHYNLTGSCQLTHLGRVRVEGRLNVTGPFGMGGGHDGGHEDMAGAAEGGGAPGHGGTLAVRGRLMFVAANGDQLTGRYVPAGVTFTRAVNGGRLQFTSIQKIGEACTGHDGGEGGMGGGCGMGGGHDGVHDEPVSTGRFASDTGQVTLQGDLSITKTPKRDSGVITLTSGLLSY